MADKKTLSTILETKYFGLILGLVVFLLIFGLNISTVLFKSFEQKLLDVNFRLRNGITTSRLQEGVSVVQNNYRISPDLMILGIDDKALSRFGRWPFPRFRHADLVNAFSRIKDQAERERALFLDVFFIEPSATPEDDALLVNSIKSSGRVFLETFLTENENPAGTDEEFFGRQEIMDQRVGTITHISGNWKGMYEFLGLQSPLKPYARAVYGFGHANFKPDGDQVYRRQPLVVRMSQLEEEIPFDQLSVTTPVDPAAFERLSWTGKDNVPHDIPQPLTADSLAALGRELARSAPQRVDPATDSAPEHSYYVIRKYKDTFLPSITLALALDYMHKTVADVEVVLGQYIRIPAPQSFNAETQAWGPYQLMVSPPEVDKDGNVTREARYRTMDEIRIPIDESGSLLINYMGYPSSASADGIQTFPVRSYSGYAANPPSEDPARWPATKAVANKIIMVGAFSQGTASDQKPTPFGLMYGIEMHANALNTILMNNFLHGVGVGLNGLILFVMIMLVSLMVSRLSTIWSLVVTIGFIIVYFAAFTLLFDFKDTIVDFTPPAVGVFLSFLAVVAYRALFEERDKRRIRDMFGKYVSPAVVDEILKNPPELGGVDKHMTVFFSDIRGFTTLSESLSPQELVNHLNLYLTAMTDLILEYKGTLDKYVGDEIMCFWGAPLPEPDHALLACKCALKQMEVLDAMNAGWPQAKKLEIGIGINTGKMTVGNMGSLGRMNYTAMGDEVNLGARLEGTNKQYYTELATHYTKIIISEYTYELVKDKVVARELDNLRVKGKNKPVIIYELIDVPEGLEPPIELDSKGKVAAGAGA
jgi:adenylate cyclase